MKLPTRIILGLAVTGAVLCSPGSASPAQAQTTTRVYLGISCEGSGIQGVAEGVLGDPRSPTRFRITCNSTTPLARSTIYAVGDPELAMPWSVKVTMTNARGVSTTTEQQGTRLPMQVTRNAIGDPQIRVISGASAVGDPELG